MDPLAPDPVASHDTRARYEQVLSRAPRAIVELLETLIRHAYARSASDLHIDPTREKLQVRMRVDGALTELPSIPSACHAELIARIKILAGLRSDEHYAAQDGRFRFEIDDACALDIRVAVLPTYYGENAVLRLLAPRHADDNLLELGFSRDHTGTIERILQKRDGLILVTGPTGSGKTTTLYTLIRLLRAQDVSVVTIEDPIEYSLDGVNQIPVRAGAGLTFSSGLRAILRQDPDIIMVGEIRDYETAALAVNAALTGHLVLSTLHTTDAATALPRLLDLGIEPYLIASTLRLVISQRLVRNVCTSCAHTKPATPEEVRYFEQISLPAPGQLTRGAGCDECMQTGYQGRVGAYEVLAQSDALRSAILARTSAEEIRAHARAAGIQSLYADGLTKVKRGRTTLEEVLRLSYE